MKKPIIKIGKYVKHNYSNFRGQVSAYCVYQNGDVNYGVRPDKEDPNTFSEMVWLGSTDVKLWTKPQSKTKGK